MLAPYYEKDGITIYHADCRDVLPELADNTFDLLLTDPPYGIGISNENLGGGRKDKTPSSKMLYGDWDASRVSPGIIEEACRVSVDQIIWGGNYYADCLPPSMGWLVWWKRDGIPERSFADVELAWTSMHKAARLFNHRWDGFLRDGNDVKNGHPTQKPIDLMQWCIGKSKDAHTILDCFMGSGTTLEAAKVMGRKCVGIEVDERYCEIAAKRLAQECFAF